MNHRFRGELQLGVLQPSQTRQNFRVCHEQKSMSRDAVQERATSPSTRLTHADTSCLPDGGGAGRRRARSADGCMVIRSRGELALAGCMHDTFPSRFSSTHAVPCAVTVGSRVIPSRHCLLPAAPGGGAGGGGGWSVRGRIRSDVRRFLSAARAQIQ